MPILQFLLLDILLVTSQTDLLALFYILELLDACQRNALLVVLAEHMQLVALVLLHLEFELANFVLLLLHLLPKLFQKAFPWILLVTILSLIVNFLCTISALPLRIRELYFDVD